MSVITREQPESQPNFNLAAYVEKLSGKYGAINNRLMEYLLKIQRNTVKIWRDTSITNYLFKSNSSLFEASVKKLLIEF